MERNSSISKVRVELFALKLKNVAGHFQGTSDPFAIVTLLANDPSEQPVVLGKTEVINKCLNPKWTTYFDIDYEFGVMTRLNIGVYDAAKKAGQDHKPMGSALFEVGEVLAARGNFKAKRLRESGDLYCRITPVTDGQEGAGTFRLRLQGHHLKNTEGLFNRTDPFFELCEKVDSAGGTAWQPVYRSKPIMNNQSPAWDALEIDMGRLCGGDRTKAILVKVWDWAKNGKHTVLGSFETTVNALIDAVVDSPNDTTKGFAVKKKLKIIAGYIIVTEARVEGASAQYTPAPTIPAQTGINGLPPRVSTQPVSPQPTLNSQSSYNSHSTHGSPPHIHTSSSAPSFSANTGVAAINTPPVFSGMSSSPSPAMPQPASPVKAQSASSYKLPSESQWSNSPSSYSFSSSTKPLPSSKWSSSASSSSFYPAPLPPPLAPPKTRPQFVQYLAGGLELELAIAIDFTGSNGDPRQPGTLHYIHPNNELNDYEKAITAVGSIITKFDHDQMISVWGFGAKYNGQINHCFQVAKTVEVAGLSGVLEAYNNVFRTGLIMSGPTVFTEVIGMCAAQANSKHQSYKHIGRQSYKVLLILTDGAVSDVEATKQALEAASEAPLSVVIVGIGNADFSAMRELDNFQANRPANGRDICKFVEFSKYKNDRRALTRETLAEIPDQLVSYYYSRGMMPMPPISGSQISLDVVSEPDDEDIDLSMTFGPGGELSLANNQGAVFDDTKYGTGSVYKPSAPPVPASRQPNSGVYRPPYTESPNSNASFTQPSNNLPNYTTTTSLPSQPSSSSVSTTSIFHVQAPPNSYPGMQVQVRNPNTGQMLLVTIPAGVMPGGTFGVRS